MISIALSTIQSILVFSALCVVALTVIVALFRMNKVRATGAYKGARISLETCNVKAFEKNRKRGQPKASRLGTLQARIKVLSSSSDVQKLNGTRSSSIRARKAPDEAIKPSPVSVSPVR